MRNKVIGLAFAALALITIGLFSIGGTAQNGFIGPQPVQLVNPFYVLTAVSATAAVNNQTTLTIAAPAAGISIYVCQLDLIISQDGTATANVNVVTTSTNFNSYALKASLAATANATLIVPGFGPYAPATGCVKSAAPATATTFVSPTAAADTAYTWKATYYVAP